MMPVKQRVRSNYQQLKMLTNYMATHLELAHGEFKGPQAKIREQELWEEVRTLLNEHGPDKTVEQWKVTWRDLRRKARQEGIVAEQALSTGNVQAAPFLSEQTHMILSILRKDADELGISIGEEYAIPIENEEAGLSRDPDSPVVQSAPQQNEKGASSSRDRASEIINKPIPITQNMTSQPHEEEAGPSRVTNHTTRYRKRQERITNRILQNISNQLAIANRHRYVSTRLKFKEKLWQLRKDLFK